MKTALLLAFAFGVFSLPFDAQMGASAKSSQPTDEDFISEALHQAVGLEKLPDVNLLLKTDTIPILVKRDTSTTDDWKLAQYYGNIPSHVDRRPIHPVDSAFIAKSAEDEDFNYLFLILRRDKETVIIDLIADIRLKAGSDAIVVDRGRMTLVYTYSNGVCTLVKLTRWFG